MPIDLLINTKKHDFYSGSFLVGIWSIIIFSNKQYCYFSCKYLSPYLCLARRGKETLKIDCLCPNKAMLDLSCWSQWFLCINFRINFIIIQKYHDNLWYEIWYWHCWESNIIQHFPNCLMCFDVIHFTISKIPPISFDITAHITLIITVPHHELKQQWPWWQVAATFSALVVSAPRPYQHN